VRGRGRGRATGTGSTSERAGSRFNSKYFGEIIAQLDDRKKDIVRDRGFGILLSMMVVRHLRDLFNGSLISWT